MALLCWVVSRTLSCHPLCQGCCCAAASLLFAGECSTPTSHPTLRGGGEPNRLWAGGLPADFGSYLPAQPSAGGGWKLLLLKPWLCRGRFLLCSIYLGSWVPAGSRALPGPARWPCRALLPACLLTRLALQSSFRVLASHFSSPAARCDPQSCLSAQAPPSSVALPRLVPCWSHISIVC